MSTAWLSAAFLLSLAVPLAEALLPSLVLARGCATALAALPWLALATCPRRTGAAGSSAAEALSILALAVPPLALAAGLDLARAAPAAAVAWNAAGVAATLLLWLLAAEIGARGGAARTGYALLWLLLLPGLAALAVALRWVPPESNAAGGAWLALDPLVWCHGIARMDPVQLEPRAAVLPVGIGLLALLGVTFLARGSRPDGRTLRP